MRVKRLLVGTILSRIAKEIPVEEVAFQERPETMSEILTPSSPVDLMFYLNLFSNLVTHEGTISNE